MGEQELMELLGLYMDLTEKQEDLIAQLTAVIKNQADRIRQMQEVYGFFDEDPSEDMEKIIKEIKESR